MLQPPCWPFAASLPWLAPPPRPSNLAAAAVALQRLWRSIARLAARLVALGSLHKKTGGVM